MFSPVTANLALATRFGNLAVKTPTIRFGDLAMADYSMISDHLRDIKGELRDGFQRVCDTIRAGK